MDPDFAAGLQVTGIGMGLVFLTLVLIMIVIRLLGRAFPTREGAPEEEPGVIRAPAVVTVAPPPVGDSDEAAAIALALAMATAAGRASAPAASVPEPEIDYSKVSGETISVIRVEPGPSNWNRQGRLSAIL